MPSAWMCTTVSHGSAIVFEYRFGWDPVKARSNRLKHDVTFDLAATVFDDPLTSSIPDDDHSDSEERWVTMGRAANGTLVVVSHTYREVGVNAANVRIISARRGTSHERRQYESDR